MSENTTPVRAMRLSDPEVATLDEIARVVSPGRKRGGATQSRADAVRWLIEVALAGESPLPVGTLNRARRLWQKRV